MVYYEKLCEKVVEIIYYAETIPSGDSAIAGKMRKKPQAGVYKNLPKILDEELRLIPIEKRSKLTGGVLLGVTQLTNLRELKRLRVLAQDRKNWKELVENIVEEAGKEKKRGKEKTSEEEKLLGCIHTSKKAHNSDQQS